LFVGRPEPSVIEEKGEGFENGKNPIDSVLPSTLTALQSLTRLKWQEIDITFMNLKLSLRMSV
jgi:hypothetical protein